MDNWETVKKIQNEINSGMAIGSADKENARFADSLEGRITKLKESLKSLVTTTISSDMAKGMVSGLTGVVDTVNNVLSALDKVGATTPAVLGTLASMFMTLKGLGTDTAIPNLFKSLAPKTWGSVADTFGNVDKSAIKMGSSLSSTGKQVAKLTNGAIKYNGTMRVVSKGFKSTKLGAVAANVGITALNAGMMALAGFGISLAVKGIDNFVNRSEKLAEASRTRQAEIKSEIDSNKQQISSLSGLSKEYDKLANKTNKTKEEVKRFNELKQEVASISPELVMGYDENNNPILAINGSLEQTIAYKKEILALDQQILAEEKKQEVEANRDKGERLWENQGYTKDKYDGGSDKAGNAQKDAFDTVLYDKDAKSYKKSLADKKTAYNEYINEMSKARSEYNEIELKAQQSAITELNSSLSGKKLNDKTLQNINSVAGSFNWGQLSASETQQVQQGFDNLNNSFSKFDTQGFQTEVNNLSRDFEAGSISKEQYEKGIGSLADTLIKAGIDVDKSTLLEALKQFPPELREIDYAMAGVLKNVGLKLSDLGSNVKADMLFNQMDKMSDLTDKFANSIETTGTIGVNLIPKVGSDIYETLPTQIQGAIDTIMADGSVSEQEAEILMKLMTSWEQDGEITSDELIELKELDGDVITEEIQAKLDADVSDDYRKYVLNNTKEGSNLNNTITSKFKAEGQDEYTQAYEKAGVEPGSKEGKKIKNKIDAKFENEGFETSQNVVDVMDSLGLSTGKEQSNFLSTIEAQIETGNINLSDLESAETILDWLYAHPEVTSKYKIDVLGKESVDAVEKSLNGLDLSKEEKKSIIMDIQEGDLTGLEASINKLPDEKRTDVIMEIGQALTSIGTVDAITLRDKLAKIFGMDLSKETVDNADAYKKNTTKNANLTATDNTKGTVNSADAFKKAMSKLVTITALDLASSVIGGIDLSTATKTIKVVAQKIGDAWNWLTGGKKSSGGGSGGSGGGSSFSGGGGGHAPVSISQESTMQTTTLFNDASAPEFSNTKPIGYSQSHNTNGKSVSSFGSKSTRVTLPTTIDITKSSVTNAIKNGINLLQELENRIADVGNQLDILGSKMKNATGTKKISYLKEQNKLYKEQSKLQKTLRSSLEKERDILQKSLKSQGVKFNKQGNLDNYEEKLASIEAELEKISKSESKSDSAKKSNEKKQKSLEELKKQMEEYIKLQYTDIPKASKEWQDLQNSIKENNDELEKLARNDKLYKFQNKVKEIENEFDTLSDKIDLIDVKLNSAYGNDKIKLTEEKLKLLNAQLEKQKQLMNSLKSQLPTYQKDLAKYGTKFDKSGNITNFDEMLNKYQNSEDLEKINELMEDYNKIVRDTLPNAEKEYAQLGNEIKDVYKDQLELTQEVEERITKQLKQQLEDRKKAIQDKADKEIEAINKTKKAYEDSKSEKDYNTDLKDQQKVIDDLNNKIAMAKKDNSLSSRSNLQSLLEQLDNENKKLQGIVEDRQNELIQDLFDKEQERVQNDSEQTIKDLEDEWTDSKIADIIKEMLGSNTFIDIDGNISNLKESMLDFAKSSGESLGAMGSIINNEIVSNLEQALKYAKDYENITKNLGLKDYGKLNKNNMEKTGSKSVNVDNIKIEVNGANGNPDEIAKAVRDEVEECFKKITSRI